MVKLGSNRNSYAPCNGKKANGLFVHALFPFPLTYIRGLLFTSKCSQRPAASLLQIASAEAPISLLAAIGTMCPWVGAGCNARPRQRRAKPPKNVQPRTRRLQMAENAELVATENLRFGASLSNEI
jgi:hypothetical protein